MSFNPYEQWDEMGVSIMLHHPISIHQAEGLGRMQVALIARIFSEGRVHVEILGDVLIGTAWLKALQAGADSQLGSITSFSTSLTHYNFNCNHEEAGPCDPITSDWWIQPIYNIYIYTVRILWFSIANFMQKMLPHDTTCVIYLKSWTTRFLYSSSHVPNRHGKTLISMARSQEHTRFPRSRGQSLPQPYS